MPLFKHFSSFEVTRNLRAFFRLEAGVVRGEAPETPRVDEAVVGSGGIEAGSIVWIFGAGRSGTTWLRDMLCSVEGYSPWEEPLVGSLFGSFHGENADKGEAPNYILSERHRAVWLGAIRRMVLDGAEARFPERAGGGYVVVKEPNGSRGAPLLSEALPESRMITVVRDPRDVCASNLDGMRQGGWLQERRAVRGRGNLADSESKKLLRRLAGNCAKNMGGAVEAHRAHKGPKTLVRYEDLNEDALGVMRRIYRDLKLPVKETKLARSVERNSWANVPEEKKGDGKFYRKAAPGSWREDLTPRQVEIVEEANAALLEEFYGA